MSVYTAISKEELHAFLTQYDHGELVHFEGISAGIENTNYFVDTSGGRFVLTIFENHRADELGYFLDLMAFLHQHAIPSASPVQSKNGQFLLSLKDKPAALVYRLKGHGVEGAPSDTQCAVMARELARLHLAGANFGGHRPNDRGIDWFETTAAQVMPYLSASEKALLEDELATQLALDLSALPKGVIHADLFKDNALFAGDELAGVIDFYYACNAEWLYDLAVMINDWCREGDGSLHTQQVALMLAAYQHIRTFTPAEQAAWPLMLRRGALRFWLSRLKDKHMPKEGEMTHIKDPRQFESLLRWHRETGLGL
jgi:homoserine kinase type II